MSKSDELLEEMRDLCKDLQWSDGFAVTLADCFERLDSEILTGDMPKKWCSVAESQLDGEETENE